MHNATKPRVNLPTADRIVRIEQTELVVRVANGSQSRFQATVCIGRINLPGP